MTGYVWPDDAECNGTDPDLFFPDRGDFHTLRAAKAVCAVCPVRRECLDYAVTNFESFGVWGGLSAKERKRIRHPSLRAELEPVGGATTFTGIVIDAGGGQVNILIDRDTERYPESGAHVRVVGVAL